MFCEVSGAIVWVTLNWVVRSLSAGWTKYGFKLWDKIKKLEIVLTEQNVTKWWQRFASLFLLRVKLVFFVVKSKVSATKGDVIKNGCI